MSDDVFVPYDELPKPHTGSFLTAKDVELFKDAFKDVARIVRCKDCKHREESVSPSWEAWCNRLHCGCDLDWFCADGEREVK